MIMLSFQINELRDKARLFEGYQNGEISRELREAADTIESLRDRLQELQGVGGESRYSELFGTPERAARMWIEHCSILRCTDCPICHDERGATCEIPGECVWVDEDGGYDALLEWLESEVRDD